MLFITDLPFRKCNSSPSCEVYWPWTWNFALGIQCIANGMGKLKVSRTDVWWKGLNLRINWISWCKTLEHGFPCWPRLVWHLSWISSPLVTQASGKYRTLLLDAAHAKIVAKYVMFSSLYQITDHFDLSLA